MQRIEVADLIRGFSLLGIFMANLLIFQYGLTGQEYLDLYGISPFNKFLAYTINILFVGSFLPIFAVLFGFSMDKLFQSMKRKKQRFKKTKLFIRAILLITLGVLHSTFIWEGDILLSYGISMLFIILFISLSKRFFKWTVILIIISFILISAAGLFAPTDDEDLELMADESEVSSYIFNLKSAYGNGDYDEVYQARNNLEDPSFELLMNQFEGAEFLILVLAFLLAIPLYIIGIYLSKVDWFLKDANHFWSSKVFIYLIPLCLLAKAAPYYLPDTDLGITLQSTFGIILSFGYMALIKWLYQKNSEHMIFIGLKSLGKLSLTIYIIQSIIGTTLFYGYGAGWFGMDNLGMTMIIFLVAFLLQMLFSTWYLTKFRYGPLEYILRVLTNFKISVKPSTNEH